MKQIIDNKLQEELVTTKEYMQRKPDTANKYNIAKKYQWCLITEVIFDMGFELRTIDKYAAIAYDSNSNICGNCSSWYLEKNW